MAHVQFGHPGVNLRLSVPTLVHFYASFFPLRTLGALLPGLAAPLLRLSERSDSAAAISEPGGVQTGAPGDVRRSGICCTEQAGSHLLLLLPLQLHRGGAGVGGGVVGDGAGEHPARFDTFIPAGPAPRQLQTKHSVGRSCLPGAVYIEAHFWRAHFGAKLEQAAAAAAAVISVFLLIIAFLCRKFRDV